MDLSLLNMYPIPENPAEEESNDIHCFETTLSVNGKIVKKFSSSSLPEKQSSKQKIDLKRKNNSIPNFITTEENENQNLETLSLENKVVHKNFNRLTVSLTDFSSLGLVENAETGKTDKTNELSTVTMSHIISGKSSKSYLQVQDSTSYLNHEPEYETLLSANVIPNVNSNQKRNSAIQDTCQKKERKESDSFVFIDLNSEDDGYQTVENSTCPSTTRQRARSMQWIHNAFQNVNNKYKDLLEFRRPSDIVEERMRKSKEGLDMEESESEVTTDINQNSSGGSRRFSENIIGKQKRFPFVGRLGHFKGFWKDKSAGFKRQEEKDNDQSRSDVCPLFSFPRKRDEDELILDTLRQAMRKCTAVDPTSRPTSTLVFDQLSNLLKES